jgi:hypothetical protein
LFITISVRVKVKVRVKVRVKVKVRVMIKVRVTKFLKFVGLIGRRGQKIMRSAKHFFNNVFTFLK